MKIGTVKIGTVKIGTVKIGTVGIGTWWDWHLEGLAPGGIGTWRDWHLVGFAIGDKDVPVVREHAVGGPELASCAALASPSSMPPSPLPALLVGGEHEVAVAVPSDDVQLAVEICHVGACELREMRLPPWALLDWSFRVVHIRLTKVELAADGRRELLLDFSVQPDDEHPLVLVLRDRDVRLPLVFEDDDPVDVAAQPLVGAKPRPRLQIG